MKEPTPEELQDMFKLVNSWYSSGCDATAVLHRLAALSMLVCINTSDPRKALGSVIETLQSVEESPMYDRLSKEFASLL